MQEPEDGLRRRIVTAALSFSHRSENMGSLSRSRENADAAGQCGPSESELISFFELSPELFCIAGGDGYFKRVNPAFPQTLGYSVEELLAHPFIEFVHPDDQAATAWQLNKLVDGIPAIRFENRYRCDDGTYRWLSWMATPQKDGSRIYAVASDVTDRKRYEAELLAGEQRYRDLLAAVTSYTYSVELRDGGYLSTAHSMGCLGTTGYIPADFAADPYLWIRMVHPDDQELVRRHAAQAMAGDATDPIEHRILHRDGTTRWVRHKIITHRDADGRLVRRDGVVEDITERKAIEERFRLLIESAPDAMVVVDNSGSIVLVNAKAEALFGYTRDELLGQTVELLVPHALRSRHAADRERYTSNPKPRTMGMHPRLSGLRKDGSEFPAEIALSPIQTDSGALVYAAVRDLTERTQLEKALRDQMSQLLAAQRIQEHLLPVCPPPLRGYDVAGALYAAEFAAGDHFDFLPMPDHCVGVVVADVSGHGVGPAILMASTHAYLHLLAAGSADLEDILLQANRLVVSETDTDYFITVFLARLDPRNGTLAYASAGHPPGYVFDAQGEVRAILPSTSLPLGVIPEARFSGGNPIALRPGDIVLLCTDGLLEAASPSGESFGWNRASEVVAQNRSKSAANIIAAMHEALTAFSGAAKFGDDVTLVVIKVVRTD